MRSALFSLSFANRSFANRTLASLLTAIFLVSGSAVADPTPASAPEALVRDVTEQVLQVLRDEKANQSIEPQEAISVIESKVVPHFDFDRMTRLAVGRAWKQATPEQRSELTSAFRTLLVRTYANALTAYSDQTVSFEPNPGAAAGDEVTVTVHSQITKPGTQAIALDYDLKKSADGWKVFDVSIANISLVTNYRSSFASELNKGGVDGLLKTLKEKNRRNEVAGHSGSAA